MEFVFVVPRVALFPEHAPHGLSLFGEQVDDWNRAEFDACIREEGFFVERPYAERTPTLKQVIPYTLVARGKDILLLQRTKGGGDARLHDKLTLGVGGHVNPVDAFPSGSESAPSAERILDPLPAATRREVMEEELTVTGETRLVPVGLINDDSNPVGAVHVGFVQVLHLLGGDAQVRETDQLRGEFVPASTLRERLEAGANFETWSSLIVPHLDQILALSSTGAGVPSTDSNAEGGHTRPDGSVGKSSLASDQATATV
jgi:predicted NUDIX family phosphoesterase